MTCCPDGCVVCEVDGMPPDPVRSAELAERDRQGREALERFLATPPRPAAPLRAPTPRLTARERGQEHRARLDEEAGKAPSPAGIGWNTHSTGFGDRRQSTTTSRVRSGRALGRTKKPRTMRDP